MTLKPSTSFVRSAALIVAALPWVPGCSDAGTTSDDGTGGFAATGGAPATGTGGATPGTGGVISTGGAPPTGGTMGGNGAGGTTGGAATGGAATGGSATGGTTNTGGSSTGGSSAGSNSKGGSSTGGSSAGSNSKGGSSTGGSSAGGSTGGANSKGGSSSGGSATGGSAAGGSPTGGANSKGGASSGGSASGGAAGAGGGCPSGITDAKQDLLTKYTPKDSSLAKSFTSYVNEEIGTPTIGTVGTGTTRTITAPIYVPACVAYDGKGEKLTGKGMGDGSQNEGQKPIFILAPGASVKNVTITAPGCEGIHMLGNNVVENIVWEDVGEDAASIRSYFPGGTILISGGSAKSAEDKTFQFNAPATVTIRNFKATDIGKLVRQNGGKDFPLSIVLENVTANNVKDAVVMSDSPQCTVKATNLTTNASTLFDGCKQL